MVTEKINFEIQPIFKTYPSVYNNFLCIEKDCYHHLGYDDSDFDLNLMRDDYVYEIERTRNHFAFGAYNNYGMIGFAFTNGSERFSMGGKLSSTDYSYYLEAFEHCNDGKKSYKEIVEKEHLLYVHEIQHYLRKHHQADDLKINESRL